MHEQNMREHIEQGGSVKSMTSVLCMAINSSY